MKKWIFAIAVVGGWAGAAWAATDSPLTTLRAVHALSNAEAREARPVAFEATVVYARGYENLLFVQDQDAALFVRRPPGVELLPGDRILIKGTTTNSFRPIVIAHDVTLVRHGELPEAVPASFDQLIRAQLDCRLVKVEGVVRAADIRVSTVAPVRSGLLQMATDGGEIKVTVDSDDAAALRGLLDAEVEVTGVAGGVFDDKMQQTGVELHVTSLDHIRVVKRGGKDAWTLPVMPMDEVLAVYHVRDLTPRIRVHGTITYYQPGSAIVLQDGAKSLWIATHTQEPLQIGDEADATGFPDAHDRLLTLTDAEVEDSHVMRPVTPQLQTWHELALWSSNSPDGHQNDLVSIEGRVATEVREALQDEYVLVADGKLVTAIYRHPPRPAVVPAMMEIPLGSKIRVTGICMILNANSVNPGEEAPFNILLRSFGDIEVRENPSLLSVRNLMLLAGVLAVVVVLVGARSWAVERKMRRQTVAAADLERRRSQILEDINGAKPLAEILEAIAEMTSHALGGAASWCEVTDGARLGTYPAHVESLRLAREPIAGRAGQPLGMIGAAFPGLSAAGPDEGKVLQAGAGLATLAIETRRLYQDLRHRSEYDLLTDIHNRFSLELHLDAQIAEARENAAIFGLVYIDLDEFKQINDQYGHNVGDLYLQEVAQRMKRQLRGSDLLARLGGDEFAVLVPVTRNRAEVEEIARRLEHSLDEPFFVQGSTLKGSASVGIAMYPEDGLTRDSLLSTADAAMYVSKHTRG